MQPRAAGNGGWIAAALAGAVIGPALQLQQPRLLPAATYLVALVAALVAALAARGGPAGVRRALVVLVASAACAFAITGLRAIAFAQDGLDPALEGRDVTVTAVVAAMPQRNELGVRLRLRVEQARDAQGPVHLPRRVQVGWYGGPWPTAGSAFELQQQAPQLRAGERWEMTVRLKAPHGHANPHGFDYELWLWEQGVQATGYVRAGPKDAPARRLGQTAWYPVEQVRQSVRDAIHQRVADRRLAGVIAALAVGDQAAIERTDWDIFRATGVAHLMSISGLHVTMFAWAAALLVGAAWRRSGRLCLAMPAQHAALVGGIALAAAYAVVSGGGVPAQRTLWMLATVALLRLSGRQWPWPWVWLLACAVVVAIDPWALTQPGFWLSFVAVGVLFASDSGRRAASAGGMRSRLRALLHEQWVVTVALTPLSLLLFGTVSVVGVFANLLAIPWVTLVVTPLALAGALVPPLWDVAAWSVQALAWPLQALAALPFATVSVAAAPWWAGVAGVAGGVLLVMRLPWSIRALGVPLLLPVALWQPVRPAPGEFELIAADIGQGNAVLVRTAAHALVYDAGPRYSSESDAGHRVLVPLLRALAERVDLLVLSHRDSDHTGGAAAVLQMQPAAGLLGSIGPAHDLHALREVQRCAAGQAWTWDGVRFEVVHPGAQEESTTAKPNTVSCVLRIGNGREAVLLAGDIEQPQEARLVAAWQDSGAAGAHARLLLVPHHGSRTSSSDAFLDAVRPSIALVQAGYRNRFGHPAPSVVDRYRQRNIRLVESARCGAATWHSARPDEVHCERQRAQRYWHHDLP